MGIGIRHNAKQYGNRLNSAMLGITSLLLATATPFALAGVHTSHNASGVVAQAATRVALAQNYTFQTVDASGKDVNNNFQTTWLNNSGLIIQSYFGTDTPFGHTAALLGSTWTIIDVPGAGLTFGATPNSEGQVALSYGEADEFYSHLAIWQRDQFTLLPDPPGYFFYEAFAINERGQVSALIFDSAGNGFCFVGDNLHHSIFGYPGSDVLYTVPFMTSDSGITVGDYFLSDGSFHAFRYDGTRFFNIDVPGGVFSAAAGINNRGEIIGGYLNSDGVFVGFRLYQGEYTNVVVPDSLQTLPYSLTDNGQIAGTYQAIDGSWHGFVATPVSGR